MAPAAFGAVALMTAAFASTHSTPGSLQILQSPRTPVASDLPAHCDPSRRRTAAPCAAPLSLVPSGPARRPLLRMPLHPGVAPSAGSLGPWASSAAPSRIPADSGSRTLPAPRTLPARDPSRPPPPARTAQQPLAAPASAAARRRAEGRRSRRGPEDAAGAAAAAARDGASPAAAGRR